MDQMEDRELQRKIEQASRIASSINDQTTYQRLREFVEELRQRLRQRLAARRTKEEIRARARELLGTARPPCEPGLGLLVASGAGVKRKHTRFNKGEWTERVQPLSQHLNPGADQITKQPLGKLTVHDHGPLSILAISLDSCNRL
jgi:hypothetical protein